MLEKIKLPDQYRTNHEHLDDQHAQLFSILFAIIALMKNEEKHSTQKIVVEMNELLEELHSYSKKHFQYEERLMEKIQYPDYAAHRSLHASFIKKIVALQKESLLKKEDKNSVLRNMAIFLKDWLMEHILIEDKKIIAFQKP
jgi:hemerythrin